MKVFLIDADNLSSSAWIEEACSSLESTEGTLAVRRAYGSADNLKGLAQTMLSWAITVTLLHWFVSRVSSA